MHFLTKVRANVSRPVIAVLHVAQARVTYTDRGKSAIVSKGSPTMAKNKSRDLASDIIDAVREGTKKWTRTVKAEERSPASRAYRASRMTRERGTSIKEAAAQIMEAAYREVSGQRPASCQRPSDHVQGPPHIQKETGRELR